MKIHHGLLATIFLSLLFLVYHYGHVIANPNGYLFSINNDGLSNYYNFAWHIKHDSSYVHFDGMAYPYGEYVHFVDAAPSLSNPIKFFSNNVIDISSYSVGILNFLVLLSSIICAAFLYLILKHFEVMPIGSILGAVGITMLSSQTILFEYGHYTLSFFCFFPIGWYTVIRFMKSERTITWSVLIAINILFWIYVHNYLGLMLLAFTTLSFTIQMGGNLKSYYHLVIQVGLPTIVAFIMVWIFDTHQGRIEWPFVTAYRTTGWTLFYSNHSALKPLLDVFLNLFNLSPPDPAVQLWTPIGSYIGLPTMIILIGSIAYWFKKRQLISLLNYEITTYVTASLIILLYSMAIPFRWTSGITDHIPFFNQFIALGRFAWVFYYVVGVASLILLTNIIPRSRSNYFVAVAAILMIIESFGYHGKIGKSIVENTNMFQDDQVGNIGLFKENTAINFKNYQAIIPLPFYYKWNTPFAFDTSPASEQVSMRLSYYSGIPLMGTYLSRPAISEGLNIIKIFSPDSQTKSNSIQSELNAKPLLVIWTKENLTPIQKLILSKSKIIYDHPNYGLYELSIPDLFHVDESGIKAEFNQTSQSGYLDSQSGYYHTKNDEYFYSYEFEDRPGKIRHRGKGAFEGKKNKHLMMFQSAPGTFKPDSTYAISFWFYNNLNQHTYCKMWLNEINVQGKVINSTTFKPFASDVFEGPWAFNEHFFKVEDKQNIIQLHFEGQNLLDNRIFMDDLLIRSTNEDFYKVISTPDRKKQFIKNNKTVLVE